MKGGRFLVTPEVLERALALPTGTSVIGCQWVHDRRAIQVFVEGGNLSGLPEVAEGQEYPEVRLEIVEQVREGRFT